MTDWAVLPVENSLGGSIHTVYDLLLRYRLHIVGETSVAVNHCLLALPGTKKEDLKRVISHPQVRSTACAALCAALQAALHCDTFAARLVWVLGAMACHGVLCCAVLCHQCSVLRSPGPC
jgi:prephenate dehydratase